MPRWLRAVLRRVRCVGACIQSSWSSLVHGSGRPRRLVQVLNHPLGPSDREPRHRLAIVCVLGLVAEHVIGSTPEAVHCLSEKVVRPREVEQRLAVGGQRVVFRAQMLTPQRAYC